MWNKLEYYPLQCWLFARKHSADEQCHLYEILGHISLYVMRIFVYPYVSQLHLCVLSWVTSYTNFSVHKGELEGAFIVKE